MSKVIVDIETVGFDFDSYDQKIQDYLTKRLNNGDESREDVAKKLGLLPFTGEVVAIGMLNPDTMKGCVLFQNKGGEKELFDEDGVTFESGTEKEILEKFWHRVKTYRQVITFNGRGFDTPFLSVRSAINRVRPTKNLMGYRYSHKDHCDLLDQLTFYGVSQRFTLEFYAKCFNINNSKDAGIDGSMVGDLYKDGKCQDIARYCARDLVTTKELYEIWRDYMCF